MYGFLMTVHIAACLLLVLMVLLQAGRGAGLAVFGGGGDAVFASPSGSSFLKQATSVIAGIFALTSLLLTLMSTRVGLRSVTGKNLDIPRSEAPARPAAQIPAQAPSTGQPAAPISPKK